MGLLDIFNKNVKGMTNSEYIEEYASVERKVNECLRKGDKESAFMNYQVLAKMEEERDDYEKALNSYRKALAISEEIGNVQHSAWLYRLIANVLFKQKKYAETIENASKSAENFMKSGSLYAAQWAYNLAAKASEVNGDVYSAIRFYRKSTALGDDVEVKSEIDRLKKLAPRPIVLGLADKKTAKEGEEIEFRVIIENNSYEPMKRVKLLDKYNNMVSEMDMLAPHEEKYFSFKSTARVGSAKPIFKKISWENIIGDSFEEQIEPVEVRVTPDVEVIVSSNPPLRLNRPSNFIILIRNKSSSAIKDAKCFVSFPDSLQTKETTKTIFNRIGPDEEKGIVFSIIPLVVGETKITNIKVSYRDEYGEHHENNVGSFVIRESMEQENGKTIEKTIKELGKSGVEYLRNIDIKKRDIQLNPHPLSQEEYIRLTSAYNSLEKGFTLRGVDQDSLSSHIFNACDNMALISSSNLDSERLFLFSGVNLDTVFLLTVAIKSTDGGLVNVLFKSYSNKKDSIEKFLSSVADIIEYTSMVMSSARAVEKIEVKQVIKIIDSIVQRSQIGALSAKNKDTTIRDSIVQKSED